MPPAPRPFTFPPALGQMADYHDGPRGGIADFDGRPHAYSSVFDHERGEYADAFDLVPVDDETLQLALESWAISMRWWRAYLAGEPVPSGPRALPTDRARHDEVVPVLRAQIPRTPPPVRLGHWPGNGARDVPCTP
jgi:hypothetical protein